MNCNNLPCGCFIKNDGTMKLCLKHGEDPVDHLHRHGDPRFYRLLEELGTLHSKKSHDYTPADDPLANFKRAERFGVPAWKGALVRMGDKWGRLEQLASGKTAQNESLRDTLIDLSVYSLLCILLLDEASK